MPTQTKQSTIPMQNPDAKTPASLNEKEGVLVGLPAGQAGIPPRGLFRKGLHAQLGRSNLKISRLCLGTMNFGDRTTEQDSFEILDRSVELGINFIDTANAYGKPWGYGLTEKIIGNWLSQRKDIRKKLILATKVYLMMDGDPKEQGLSARHIKKACEDSLKRLKIDHIDLYQMHHVDRETPMEETLGAMASLIKDGKVLYIGSSNFAGWDIAVFNEKAKQAGMQGLVSEQSRYNLTLRAVEREVIPACEHYGMNLLPWSPLGGGFLAAQVDNDKKGRRSTERMEKWLNTSDALLAKWTKFCDDLNEEPAQVALAWLLHQKTVAAPIIGPRTLQQLEKSMASLQIKFSDEQLKTLDEMFPPAGRAPEYYAW